MPILNCKICSKTFYIKPSHVARGNGKYCSNKCSALGRRKGKFVVCSICGKKIWRMPRHLDHSRSGKYFCSKSCQTHWRNSIVYVGQNHPNWKGGWSIYRDKLSRTHIPKICKRCEIGDIRILAVHHIDKNRSNNDIKNLMWLCHNCHFLIHNNKIEYKKFMEALV